jgi:glutamate racemase
MIGLFDSGLGGLSILKAFKDRLPAYDYVYYGDSRRAPYGNKKQEDIFKFTTLGVDFLFKKGCKIIILACNTASSKALRRIQQEWLPKNYPKNRVLGIIIPVAQKVNEEILKNMHKNKVAIIGTEATIKSAVYEKEFKKLKCDLIVYKKSCPLLVPLIEKGVSKKKLLPVLKQYLKEFKEKNIDYFILGCTHYSFLKKEIKDIAGERCEVFDSPCFVAEKFKLYLKKHKEIESCLSKNNKIFFYSSDPGKVKTIKKVFSKLDF